MLEGPAANKETTDPALIEDLVRTLRDGAPLSPALPSLAIGADGSPVGVHGVLLFSEQLPGLMFRPWIYLDASGQVYLAEDLLVKYGTEQSAHAAWIPASPLFARWTQTP
jgi:hypothetical protein